MYQDKYQSMNDFYVNNLVSFYFDIIYRSQIIHCFQYFVNQCNCSKGWQFLALLRDYHLANNLLSVIEIVTPSYDNFLNNRQNTYKVDAHCIASSSNVKDLFRILQEYLWYKRPELVPIDKYDHSQCWQTNLFVQQYLKCYTLCLLSIYIRTY